MKVAKMKIAEWMAVAENAKKLVEIQELLRRISANPDRPDTFLRHISASHRPDLARMVWAICLVGEEEVARIAEPGKYKPAARFVTLVCLGVWPLLVGKIPTRVTKRVDGRMGVQECGEFAAFLAEVFAILGIKASAAGQVRMVQQRLKRFARPVKIP